MTDERLERLDKLAHDLEAAMEFGYGLADDGKLIPLTAPAIDPAIVVWKVVCTDRGQHPERPICTLFDRRQTAYGDIIEGSSRGAPMGNPTSRADRRDMAARRRASNARRPSDATASTTSSPRCRTCGRTPEVSQARLVAVIDALLKDDPARRRVIDLTWLG